MLCALLLVLGSDAIDSGLNAYAAGAFGVRHMNWLHAFFGLGVAPGPLIMTTVIGLGLAWPWGYAAVAAGQLVLTLAFLRTARLRRGRSSDHDHAGWPFAPRYPARSATPSHSRPSGSGRWRSPSTRRSRSRPAGRRSCC